MADLRFRPARARASGRQIVLTDDTGATLALIMPNAVCATFVAAAFAVSCRISRRSNHRENE
jgi:hypothetical protein